MLSLLKIKNIALIDEVELEFGRGLNLLTGETGSGKSIIVDSLGALTGERMSSELIKEGESAARIEGLFQVKTSGVMREIFDESGVELEDSSDAEVIVRRELSSSGKNRIFVNNQLVTQAFLRKIGTFLVDIHGQGEQATLFNQNTHLEILDNYARVDELRGNVAVSYKQLTDLRSELRNLQQNEAEKLQLLDILRFQVDEIAGANLQNCEDEELEEEKKRLNNVEKLSTLSEESYSLLYENEEAVVTNLERILRKINELAEFDGKFKDYLEGLQTAQAIVEDLAFSVRDFRQNLEFSPERLAEIENRLAEISRLKRKYGGTIESTLQHFDDSTARLNNIETAELREEELRKRVTASRLEYLQNAGQLHERRLRAKRDFEKQLEENLKDVSLEKARFEVRIEAAANDDKLFTINGFDAIEFYFSANPGESVKPIIKVASGGELSRLMLVLNTVTNEAQAEKHGAEKTLVFDEIDTGIGGRVAEAVGIKLKNLAKTQQVLCVTHQPQVAALADQHFLVEKASAANKTTIKIKNLDKNARIEEVARMLAGEKITASARTHAAELVGLHGATR